MLSRVTISPLIGQQRNTLPFRTKPALGYKVRATTHGASGTHDDDLRRAISAGITVVHINTELRLAWRHGLDSAIMEQPEEIVPYKILPHVIDSMKKVVAARLALFNDSRHAQAASN